MQDNQRARFQTGVRKLLYATSGTRSPDPEILNTYWHALKDYQLPSVERVLAQAIATEADHVPPAKLRAMLSPVDMEADAQLAHRRKERIDSGPCRGCLLCTGSEEWRAMIRQACMAYARRVCGTNSWLRQALPENAPRYAGSFPWQMIVDNAPLPSDPSPESHKYAWRAFFRVCVEEWNMTQEAACGVLGDD